MCVKFTLPEISDYMDCNLSDVNSLTLNDRVYRDLYHYITTQPLDIGTRLDLRELETLFNVSRTPLKNALTRLENEGLVEVQPRRGTFIANMTQSNLEEAYKIRSAFELYVALCLFKYLTDSDFAFFDQIHREMNQLARVGRDDWLAVIHQYLQLDRQLHERIIAVGGTPRMLQLFQQTHVHTHLSRISAIFHPSDFDAMHFEHEQLFAALEERSPERLSATLLNHLEASRIRTLKRLSECN